MAQSEAVYKHAMEGSVQDFDPARAGTTYSAFFAVNLFDTLYRYKYLARPYQLAPNLAAGMPTVSADGLEYQVSIKHGVLFHPAPCFANSDRELTADDIVYSFKRHFLPAVRSQAAPLWRHRIKGLAEWASDGANLSDKIEGIVASDKYSVTFRLSAPHPEFISLLATGYAGIVSKKCEQEALNPEDSRTVGSGPFRLGLANASMAELQRNPEFRKEPIDLAFESAAPINQDWPDLSSIAGAVPPLVDRVEIHFIPQSASRWQSFAKGNEVQFLRTPHSMADEILASRNPPRLKPELKELYRLFAPVETGLVRLDINMTDPQLGRQADAAANANARAIRCAMSLAFDWDEWNAKMYSGLGQSFSGVIPPGMPGYRVDGAAQSQEERLTKARALLAEHQISADLLPQLEYAMPAGPRHQQGFELFRASMLQLGFPASRVKSRSYATFADYNRAYKQGQAQLMLLGWGMDYPDPENILQLYFGPNKAPGPNAAQFDFKPYNDLYQALETTQDPGERAQLYAEMNAVIKDQCPTIAGTARRNLFLTHKNVLAVPDRDVVNGYFLRFVKVEP